MQDARSTRTGLPVAAWDFSQESVVVIEEQRRDFVCIACGGPAFWVKPGASGKGPYFAARPHEADCDFAVRTEGPWGPEGDHEVARWESDQARLVLVLPEEGGDDLPAVSASGQSDIRGGRQFVASGGEPLTTRVQRGPQRLLRQLLASPRFRSSDLSIVLPDGHQQAANRFFVPFDRADHSHHADMLHGYWGIPHRLSRWQRGGSMYLQAAEGRDNNILRFVILQVQDEEICGRFRLNSIDELSGKYLLFIGVARPTTSGRFTLALPHPRFMAVADPGIYPLVA